MSSGSAYPISDRFFVLKDDRSHGPYSVDELLIELESGRFDLTDVCLREGALEMERIQDVIDWDDDADDAAPSTDTAPSEGIHPHRDDRDDPEKAPPSTQSKEGLEEARPDPPEPGRVLYSGHPSILTYPLALLGLIGGVVGAIWLFPIDPRYSMLAAALALVALVRLSWVKFTSDYLITARRVEVISGLIARSSREVRISDIRAINVTCSGWTGFLGIGTVDFFTIGDAPEVTFHRIWSAREIKQLVRRLQDDS